MRVEVREPSVIELTVRESVQLDRLRATAQGVVAERQGALLEPGVTTLALEPGQFFFKTMSDADLRVVCGGVTAVAHTGDLKDSPPSPPWPDPTFAPPRLGSRGDDAAGSLPTLTVS